MYYDSVIFVHALLIILVNIAYYSSYSKLLNYAGIIGTGLVAGHALHCCIYLARSSVCVNSKQHQKPHLTHTLAFILAFILALALALVFRCRCLLITQLLVH